MMDWLGSEMAFGETSINLQVDALLAKPKLAAYADKSHRGWTTGVRGTQCSICDGQVDKFDVVFRANQVMVLHSRCLKILAEEAPSDTVEEASLELKELLDG